MPVINTYETMMPAAKKVIPNPAAVKNGISHTLGRCISNIGTPPFSNIGTVRYGAERVKLRRFFIGGTQDDGVRTAQTFPRLSRPLTLLSGL